MVCNKPSDKRVLVQENCTHSVPGNFEQENCVETCSIEVKKLERDEIVFHIVGVPSSFVNSIRRCVMSEVPTMTIDKIDIRNNTSIIFDEMLAHRLGLVPIRVDPSLFEFRNDESLTEDNCVKFTLKVKCESKSECMKVCSEDLKWETMGGDQFKDGDIPAPVHPDILIAKLNYGQEIDLDVYCLKGCGRDHAKFSPAVPVSIQPMTVVEFKAPVVGENARKLKELFKNGVDLVNVEGVDTAVVKDPLECRHHWRVFEDEELKKLVKISFDKNHHIFTLEGSGCCATKDVVKDGIQILRDSYKTLLDAVADL